MQTTNFKLQTSKKNALPCAATILLLIIFSFILLPSSFCLAGGGANFHDVNGADDLTVTARLKSASTGTPPNVTPGGTTWTFASCGGGTYYRELAEGDYHFFVGGAWVATQHVATDTTMTLIAAMGANGWVTTVRIGTNAVTNSKIDTAAISLRNMGLNSVGSSQVIDGAMDWNDLSANVKGTGCNTAYTLKKVQDSIDLLQADLVTLKGGWNSSTDFTMNALDSVVKTVVLNLAFTAAPNCSVRTVVSSAKGGYNLRFEMNSVHNDSAVRLYVVWVMEYPTTLCTLFGFLDEDAQGDISVDPYLTPMWNSSVLFRPGQKVFVSDGGTDEGYSSFVLAYDWQGHCVGSGQVDPPSGLARKSVSVGETIELLGVRGYVEGKTLAGMLANAMLDIDNLKAGYQGGVNKILLHADHDVGSPGVKAIDLHYYSTKVTGPPQREVNGTFTKVYGFENLEFSAMAKMKSVGGKGYYTLELNRDGGYGTPYIGGTSTGADTTWTQISLTRSILTLPTDTISDYSVSMYSSSADSMLMKYVTVWMVR